MTMRQARRRGAVAAAAIAVAAALRTTGPLVAADANFAVVLHDADTAPGDVGVDAAAADTQRMTAADGTAFTCVLPPLTGRAGRPDAGPTGDADTARRAATIFNGGDRPCLVSRPDFWTIELCPGRGIRQFHAAPGGGGGGSDAAPAAAEHALGEYDTDADAAPVLPGGAVAYVQSYPGGSGGRSATVTVLCEPPELAAHVEFALLRVDEPSPLAYALTVGTRNRELCALLPSPSRLLRAVNGTCTQLYRAGEWWTYHFCVGGALRQFHDAGPGVGPQAESVIGVYAWAYGERLDGGGGDGGGRAQRSGAPPPAAGAILQRYTDGSACGVKGGALRQATVRFVCMPAPDGGGVAGAGGGAPSLALLDVREPETCVYDVDVGTPAVCDHPGMAPLRRRAEPGPPATIHCFPVREGDE